MLLVSVTGSMQPNVNIVLSSAPAAFSWLSVCYVCLCDILFKTKVIMVVKWKFCDVYAD